MVLNVAQARASQPACPTHPFVVGKGCLTLCMPSCPIIWFWRPHGQLKHAAPSPTAAHPASAGRIDGCLHCCMCRAACCTHCNVSSSVPAEQGSSTGAAALGTLLTTSVTHPASAGHVAGCLWDCHCCLCKDPTTALLTMPRWPCRSACSREAAQRLHSEVLAASCCSRPCMSSALASSPCTEPATDCCKTASTQEYMSISEADYQVILLTDDVAKRKVTRGSHGTVAAWSLHA